MTGSSDETEDVLNDREQGQALYDIVCQIVDEDDRTPAGEVERRTRAERLAEAQLHALQAIYCELRHGHDQARQHTDGMRSHANAMDKLRGALYDHGAAMGRMNGAMADHAHEMSRLGRML
ncbi:hypothetical protein [Saccharomonospora piscinae]|uniref:hypothetical protein n=1 Tax=Saccharomonospora piscinae TaxID=687388 RepID=UPI00111BF14F|nr:hypothetical protein [Saccharomonospora piscinae]